MAPKKDPNAPKRALSAYFIWLNEMRPKFKEQNPNAKVTDISKIAGAEWSKVTDKSKWEALAQKDKQRYEKEMAAYQPQAKGGH